MRTAPISAAQPAHALHGKTDNLDADRTILRVRRHTLSAHPAQGAEAKLLVGMDHTARHTPE
ncbi:MAG: hypothetical protein AAFP99_05940 [Pseudomonadota bacterium]